MAKKDIKKALRDFWYGKPHSAEEGGRRLGDLHEEKTHLYKHREWRGVKDTLYYFYMIWLYNYIFMVKDVMVMGGPLNFAKGVWSPPTPACTAESRTSSTSTRSPTTRRSGAVCSIPGTARSQMSRWR